MFQRLFSKSLCAGHRPFSAAGFKTSASFEAKAECTTEGVFLVKVGRPEGWILVDCMRIINF